MDFERRLQAALAPRKAPPSLHAVILAQVAAASRTRKPSRRFSRVFLLGSLVAMAAAAVMLVKNDRLPAASETAPAADSDRGRVVEVSRNSGFGDTGPTQRPLRTEASTAAAPTHDHTPSASVPPAPKETFGVHLLPLQDGSTDPVGRAAVQALHTAIVQRLRTIPGLVLVEAAAGDVPEAQSIDYRITINAAGEPYPGTKFMVALTFESVHADGSAQPKLSARLNGDMAPACSSAGKLERMPLVSEISCADPVGIGIYLVDQLRRTTFPAEASLQDLQRAQLLDSALDAGSRFRALDNLLALGARRGQRLDDPAVTAGLIDLAAAADPQVRARAWRQSRGVRRQELIPALVTAARSDPDDEARREAVGTLASDFATQATARSVLEAVAREDTSALVRAVAQRGLADEGWRASAIAMLIDDTRSAKERAEALMFYTAGVGPVVQAAPADSRSVLRDVDDQAIEAIAAALVDHRPEDSRARLALARSGDVRMRAAIARISAEDPDAIRRQNASIHLLSFPAQ